MNLSKKLLRCANAGKVSAIAHLLFFILLLAGYNVKAQADSTVTNPASPDTGGVYNIPIFSSTGADAEADQDQQDVSSLLQASRDVFTQFASFQFGAARYRIRGYQAENHQIMINGVNTNNLESGYSSWSSWGGLNDVTRYVENRVGITSSRYGFSGPGGYTNIDSRASSFKPGITLSYANANRIFGNRFMATYSTGLMRNGWALTASASHRQGNEVYIPGTYFNGSSYYLSVEKKINDKQLFGFTGFMAPVEQGRSSFSRLESYKLADDNFYNEYWGYQKGKVRNTSVSRAVRPMLMLSHVYHLDPASRITTTLFYTFGKKGLTRLNWNGQPNPKPDYYRYLPSTYYEEGDTVTGDHWTRMWENDVNVRQINWDRMIALNKANLFVLPSKLGQGINTTQTRARYILENQVEDLHNYGLNLVYNKRIDEMYISAGVNSNEYKNRKYKVLEDLLGADFWLDYDQFADGQGINPEAQQNNLNEPDKKITKGDKFGYDYSVNIRRTECWGQVEQSYKMLDVYAALSLSGYTVWKESFMANGKFPSSSQGESEKTTFTNIGTKLGATYKINGRHSVSANGSFLTRPPEVNNIFISQTVRNDLVTNIGNEKVLSAEVSYNIKMPDFKFRTTLYHTRIDNQLWVRTFYHDNFNTFVNMIMKGVNQINQGVELSLEKTIFTSHVFQGALGLGRFFYSNRPLLELWQYNNAVALYSERTAYIKNYRIGGSPQMVAGGGYKYNGKRFWYAGIYINYFDELYVEANPERRTAEAVSKYHSDETGFEPIIAQEKLPSYFTLNLNGGKSFRLSHKYTIRVNVSANNLLNNKNIIIGGFEQLRWDAQYLNRFDSKYAYMPGVTYMATINLSF